MSKGKIVRQIMGAFTKLIETRNIIAEKVVEAYGNQVEEIRQREGREPPRRNTA